MSSFGSFWSGTLSPYEICCLGSFAQKGHDVTVYSYGKLDNLPDGVRNADAREIVDESFRDRFITNGKPNIAHFSDYFRYLMQLKTNLCWIDTDIVLLQDFTVDANRNFFVQEDGHISIALLRIESRSPELKTILRKTESILDRDVPWSTTQIFTAQTFKKVWHDIQPFLMQPEQFMPIHYSEYYKLLLPEYSDECAEKCRNAKTVHLYNNILGDIGTCKTLLPPEGSYLHRLFANYKPDPGFCGTYPVSVMRAMVNGRRMRYSGENLRLKAVIKQIIPGFRRGLRWKIWNR